MCGSRLAPSGAWRAAIAGVLLATATTLPAAPAGPLVFAAASLHDALDAVIAVFHRATGAPAPRASYASSSTLARQIEAGAEPAIYISADTQWMDYVERRGLIEDRSRRNLLGNALVLVAPASSTLRLRLGPGADIAGALGDGRLAMGDPAHVPAGIYAKAALEHLGLWKTLAPRAARAADVRAALALVARGEAPLGIVYRSDAVAEPRVRVVDTFAPDTHPRIVYPAALTRAAHGPEAARFLDFLRTREAGAIFTRYGFDIIKSP